MSGPVVPGARQRPVVPMGRLGCGGGAGGGAAAGGAAAGGAANKSRLGGGATGGGAKRSRMSCMQRARSACLVATSSCARLKSDPSFLICRSCSHTTNLALALSS